MKKIESKDFEDGIEVYSGIKDYYGNNCLALVNNDLKEIRIVSKNRDYTKKRKHLNSIGLTHVKTSKYSEVIDFTRKVANMIEREFSGYKHTEWSIWND